MKQDVMLVLDCGATNVRAIAVNRQGKIITRASVANASERAAENGNWHQWSLEAILQRFADCCRKISAELAACRIRGITVTTFGVDGALVDKQGELLYPVISWKCPRTAAIMEDIRRVMPPQQLQEISGVGAFSFNTLYKLVWLKQHHPQLLAQAHAWLFISSLINQRLTGEFTTDITMAGTSQMLDIQQRDFSPKILQATGLPRRLFPRLVAAGDVIGTLRPAAANTLGLPAGIPVIATGHDTQFALFGAGADQDEPVLSSGTWEILMVRSAAVDTRLLSQHPGSTCELDSQTGRFNPGMQWLASGVLEWVRKLLWTPETPWQTLIDEAGLILAGAEGVKMHCNLLNGQNAGWQGVTLNTTRGHFYRAALEGLTEQLQRNLHTLENIGHFSAKELLLVGGGSRNTLWNQIKANLLNIPIKVLDEAETTVIGAALFGWYGVGEFASPELARAQIHYQYRYFYPQTEPEFTEEA
ncbi:L-fuculokinase [Candidatus Symbiopectobacterium sp. NZEC127]|uniref:L-fuculokinase n=1 Tax=Candidatus Symbiopectobacterium sp. NZEC127 TaxID=2820472 RepID=UPI0022262B1E|nr:L-fuculokinase [Candidatus Symbiopectobacterium sp. NZEC127]MCW2485183.1 L-fuculokinase [Candidatus Symbiopectobacterium sp. NZEC127]